ncbi:IclR family transcriptional regulator [Haloarcula sp. JP-L23]|uniref:IclR family transcriptional regulator n=1 Tax=Haloarcula sp. JP-L23 TaxID=2716717 RepID=UPI00140EA0DF|nr:IclR family transcriptional regulator [Haloarcula sp. JP-L23]
MENDDIPKRWSPVTDTVFEIIETLDELDEATVTVLADHLDLAASTVHNHLGALQRRGFVIKEDKRYRLGLQFLHTGMSVRNKLRMREVSQSAVDDLARETDEAAWAATLENDWIYFICSARGEDAIQAYGDLGARRRPHSIAAGKSILAHLPEETVHGIINRTGLEKHTENTITSRDELFEDFESIRERGFALNRGERLDGGRAVACAILQDGEPLGSIGVSGPAHRFEGEQFTDELPSAVLAAKNIIELDLSSPS